MKLKTIWKLLNTDELFLTCGESFVKYEGKELFDALNRHGEQQVIKITPGDNYLDIEIK